MGFPQAVAGRVVGHVKIKFILSEAVWEEEGSSARVDKTGPGERWKYPESCLSRVYYLELDSHLHEADHSHRALQNILTYISYNSGIAV